MPDVIYDNGSWRMWYRAAPPNGGWYGNRVAYAESNDGITWRKPELGLTEFNGSKRNNLVKMVRVLYNLSVMIDKEAPPEHRYVLAGEDMIWWLQNDALAGPSTAAEFVQKPLQFLIFGEELLGSAYHIFPRCSKNRGDLVQ